MRKLVLVRLPEELRDRLDSAVKRLGSSRSALVRMAVQQFISRDNASREAFFAAIQKPHLVKVVASVDADDKNSLVNLAKSHGCSINNTIVHILDEFLPNSSNVQQDLAECSERDRSSETEAAEVAVVYD